MSYPLIRFTNENESPLANLLAVGTRVIFDMIDGALKITEIIDADGTETFIGTMSAA